MKLEDAIHRMTGQPASVLNLADRGRLEKGYFADVVVFDPATIQDHATYAEPHQYATGVSQVIVNGVLALENGRADRCAPGPLRARPRLERRRGSGGCRAAASDWDWPQGPVGVAGGVPHLRRDACGRRALSSSARCRSPLRVLPR